MCLNQCHLKSPPGWLGKPALVGPVLPGFVAGNLGLRMNLRGMPDLLLDFLPMGPDLVVAMGPVGVGHVDSWSVLMVAGRPDLELP